MTVYRMSTGVGGAVWDGGLPRTRGLRALDPTQILGLS
jgi:hypothetical protein